MEDDKKIEKQVYSSYKKIAAGILTFIVSMLFLWKNITIVILMPLIFGFNILILHKGLPVLVLSVIIVTFITIIRSLYLYIKYILESFSNKKRIRSIILSIILILVVTLFMIQESLMNEKFVNLTYSILIVTCISIIPIVRYILDLITVWKKYKGKKEKKVTKIILTIAIIIIMVASQFFMLLYSYSTIKSTIKEYKEYSFSEIFALKEKKEVSSINTDTNIIENPHISAAQRNVNITFAPNSKLREDWITSTYKYNEQKEGAENYTFKNDINLDTENKELSYMKVCFQLNDDLTNFVPVEDNEENYNKIHSYLIASSKMEITLKPGVELQNKYYTLRLNRYDKDFNILTNCEYIFEPVAEITKDSEGRQVIYITYDNYYPLGKLKNIEIILGKEQ